MCCHIFLKCANRSDWCLGGWTRESGVSTVFSFYCEAGCLIGNNTPALASASLLISSCRGLIPAVVSQRQEQGVCGYWSCGCGTKYRLWGGSVWGAASQWSFSWAWPRNIFCNLTLHVTVARQWLFPKTLPQQKPLLCRPVNKSG